MTNQTEAGTMNEPALRNISDTALWTAVHRARETERADALFRDPLAGRLAGERGLQIAAMLPFGDRNTWSFIARTCVFDGFVVDEITRGTDMVVNLAAGLDTRPYRMSLPASLQWVEIDLPGIIDYKEQVLHEEKPACRLERVRLDLTDVKARRDVFAKLGQQAKRALIMCEGLLVYLSRDEVSSLAKDLAAPAGFHSWALDMASPGLLKLLQKNLGGPLSQAGSSLKFGPEEGPAFFSPSGWKLVEVHSMLKTAARLGRLSWVMRLLALLPESNGRQGSRPWGAGCLFTHI
jgi:methyltransferase (TIGR00027 family)